EKINAMNSFEFPFEKEKAQVTEQEMKLKSKTKSLLTHQSRVLINCSAVLTIQKKADREKALHILTDRSEKTALCSKHYKEWLIIKSKYYQLALKEFFETDELTHLETNLSQSQTAKERQSLIANHPLNKYGFGFSEEVKLLLILKGLEIEFQLAHDKLNIKNLALLIAGIT
ncbi:43898_t:CDS:2, partial [Gigaspora margarita]